MKVRHSIIGSRGFGIAGAAALLAGLLMSLPAGAQSFPGRPVTIIVPFGAGGPVDVVTRAVAAPLEERWKQPVIVDIRPGAGGMIGMTALLRTAPDGQTLMASGDGVVTTKIFIKDAAVEPTDFRAVAQLVWAPRLVVIPAAVPAKTLAEFIAYARANPGRLNFGTIANTSFDLEYALFMEKAGIQMTGIPYNGSAPASVALLRNEVQFLFGIASSVGPQIADGKLVALAVTSADRYEPYRNLPTIRETGIDYDATTNFGLWAPAKTPDEVVTRISADVSAVLKTPAVATRIRAMGYEPAGITGQHWAEQINRQARDYAEMARRKGIKPQ